MLTYSQVVLFVVGAAPAHAHLYRYKGGSKRVKSFNVHPKQTHPHLKRTYLQIYIYIDQRFSHQESSSTGKDTWVCACDVGMCHLSVMAGLVSLLFPFKGM